MTNRYVLQFDGVDGLVAVPNDAALNVGSGNFSISLWVKMPSGYAGGRIVLTQTSSGAAYYQMILSGALYRPTLNIHDDTTHLRTISYLAGAWSLNVWHHVVFTCDKSGSGIAYYDNVAGTPVAITTVGDMSLDGSLVLGDGTTFFGGLLDDIRVYKGKVLSQEEIALIYNSGMGSKLDHTVLGCTWGSNCDSGEGTTLVDDIGAVDGTITGGVTWVEGGTPFPPKGTGTIIHGDRMNSGRIDHY